MTELVAMERFMVLETETVSVQFGQLSQKPVLKLHDHLMFIPVMNYSLQLYKLYVALNFDTA